MAGRGSHRLGEIGLIVASGRCRISLKIVGAPSAGH